MQKLLTLNAGSSSIKFAVFNVDDGTLLEQPLLWGSLSGLDGTPSFEASGTSLAAGSVSVQPQEVIDHDTAWEFLCGWVEDALCGDDIVGVGHRIVHGGINYAAPVVLTSELIQQLTALTPLAPGHQPHNLAGIAAITRLCPIDRQVACFDTAFHRTQLREEEIFAIPRKFTQEGIMRYGFHGLSYEYIVSTLATALGDYPKERVIVAHLGAGASLCAIRDGKSVATTMGFTALDGLPMATRCGAIDPGVILYLLTEMKMSPSEVADCLYKESGLLGISGISGDMRVLEASHTPHAREAINYFVHRIVREIGALVAVLGGIDALIFTAGIGENAASIRQAVIEKLAWLGFLPGEPIGATGMMALTQAGSIPSAWVIPTNEEMIIARHTLRLTVL